MKNQLLVGLCSLVLSATLLATPIPDGSSADCLPDGDSTTLCFPADWDGPTAPAHYSFVDGSATAHESDASGSQDMGAGSHDGGDPGEICVKVTNNGGDLAGPNGVTQNGGDEGDCIEVFVKFKLRYKATICDGVELEPGEEPPAGASCYQAWRTRSVTTKDEAQSLCPC